MTLMPVMPRDHEWTVDDLDALPDDGLQYELFDGALVVSPAPTLRHQIVARNVFRLLDTACPPGLEPLFAPVDFRPSRRSSVQPDLLVIRTDQTTGGHLTHPPLLVVEVLSPSTRMKDVLLKRALYANSGVGWYWIVDPAAATITVLELHAGVFVESGLARVGRPLTVERPFPVRLDPDAILG